MSKTTMYYLGTGKEFIKAQCKPYKTIEGAFKAAAKDESLVVWDENGNIIGSLTDNVPDGALTTNADGSDEPQDNTEGENISQGTDEPTDGENGENGANNEQQSTVGENVQQENEPEQVEEQTGRFNITVVCEGSLRLRRSASFTIDNECGRASKGQTYIGKRIFMCDGLPMVETIDGLFLSAAACHVNIEKVR